MKLPRFMSRNLVLKVTSLNTVVMMVKLLVSVFIQRFLAITVGEVGIAKIGQLRNVMDMIGSISTLGTSEGIIKYVSEYKEARPVLAKLFSTTFVFTLLASLCVMLLLFFGAPHLAVLLFDNVSYAFVIKILSLIVPFVAVYRVCSAVVKGLMDYKTYAKAELMAYLLSSVVLVAAIYTNNLSGVLIAIAIAPLFYFIVLAAIYKKVIQQVIEVDAIKFRVPFYKHLLGFSVMSISVHILLNYVEIDLRHVLTTKLNVEEAGYWTAMTNLSNNYMVFATSILTVYVLPKFASLKTLKGFKMEVFHIYKTLLPLFVIGMIIIYIFRNTIIEFVYPNFSGLEPLFKWQLLADFIRFASMILAFQFVAKKRVLAFVITEIFSAILFYFLANYLIQFYGTQGVVIANFIRYILYFILVLVLLNVYFKQLKSR